MRVMVFVKATEDSEKGVDFTSPEMQKMMDDMGKFNDELLKAGIMEKADDCAGITESARGKRVRFDGTSRTVTDGPFGNPNDIVTGYWFWTVKDMDEAVAWVKRCPNPMPGPSEIEIRPLYAEEDFA
jgi:hypothetical protein